MNTEPEPIIKKRFLSGKKIVYMLFGIAFIGIFSYYLFSAPLYNRSVANREPSVIHITYGESIDSISIELAAKHIVRYASVVKRIMILFKMGRPVAIGDYLFTPHTSAWSIGWQIARGHHNINPIKVTLPEGVTNDNMAEIFSQKISSFRRDIFTTETSSKQGYLFPDTYFLYPMSTSDEIVKLLTSTFNKEINPLMSDINKSGRKLSDIIIMASIIQKEAKGADDSYVISGILWKRIKEGMRIEVDAARSTYSTTGLPSAPISNPGLVAIRAALYPEDSPYYYYLHDKSGRVHFARTFEEHKSNISNFLR